MAQFRGTMQGRRGKVVSRLGNKSGFGAIVNGWNIVVRVVAAHIDGEDQFQVYRTGGSNGRGAEKLLLTLAGA